MIYVKKYYFKAKIFFSFQMVDKLRENYKINTFRLLDINKNLLKTDIN